MILIAGNGSGNAASLKGALDRAGFLTSSTADMMTAITRCATERPDLVLLDAVGSGDDCRSVCRGIGTLLAGMHVPILVILGGEEIEAGCRVLDAGATDIVVEPLVAELLVGRMRRLLRDARLVASLAKRERHLAGAQRIARVGNWDFNPVTGMITGSEETFRILGIPRDPDTISFETFLLTVHSADRHMVASSLVEAWKRNVPCTMEFKVDERTLRLSCLADEAVPGEEPCLKGTLQDVTALRGEEERLRMLRQAVDCLPIGFTLSDSGGRIIYSNPAEAEIHGYTVEELVGMEARIFAPRGLRKPVAPGQFNSFGVMQRESVNVKKSGEEFPVRLTSIPVRYPDGRCVGLVTTCEDIARQKEDERKIHKLAYYDPLTGLPNRGMFLDRLHQALALALRERRKLCLVFLDLDNFKDVNDTHGHDFGDKLLQDVAGRLSGAMRESDTLARFGGDEFVLLLTSITSPESPALAAQRILSVFADPVGIDGRPVHCTASLGLALYPDDGTDAESLFKCADTAMYHAKNEGKSCYHFYSGEMNRKIMRRVALENSLRQGLEKDEFFLEYQPKWDLKSSRMLGAEALLRWRSSDLGLVNPSEFIVLTESSGLIFDLGRWVLRSACRQAKHWEAAGHRDFKVAVNISGKQLRCPDFFDTVETAVRESGIDPTSLELEFTESVIMEQAERSMTTLESLKKIGVQLSIDDFGTGYSSLNYLKNFPVARINIDRSFIAGVNQGNDAAALVEAIISMGHSLNLKVLAEGVETGDQLRYLAELGCDEVQGFYLAEPMSPADLTRIMAHGDGSPLDWGDLAGIRNDDGLVMWVNE